MSRIAHRALETLRRQRRRREKECIRDSRQSDLDLGAYTFTVRGTLAGPPPINSVPDSPIGLVGALTLLATLAVGHFHGRRPVCRSCAAAARAQTNAKSFGGRTDEPLSCLSSRGV